MKTKTTKSVLLILGIIFTLNFKAINRTASGLFANWNNPTTWTPIGVPTSTDDVFINGAIIQSGNVQVGFIIISNSGGIINSGTITLGGSFINNGTYIDNGTTVFNGIDHAVAGNQTTTFNNLVINCAGTTSMNVPVNVNNLLSLTSGTLNSLSNLTLVNDGTNNGRIGYVGTGSIFNSFTAQKWMTKCDSTFSEFGSCMTQQLQDLNFYYTGFPGANYYPSFTFINAYFYDETISGPSTNGYVVPTNVTSPLGRGQGLTYWFKNFSSSNDFPRVMPMVGTLDFQAPFNFGINYTNSGLPSDDGFNMLANPFPGTIDWDASSGWTKTNVDNAIYVWDNCAGLYTSHAGNVSINGGSRYISEGQAFWVQAIAPTPNLECTAQIISSVSINLLRTSSFAPNVAYIRFNGDEIAVRLDANGTNTIDSQFDAVKFYSDSSKIASCVITNTLLTYGINTVFSAPSVTVPLITKRSGLLNFQNVSSFVGYTVKLKDKTTNSIYPLTDNYNYFFNETDTVFHNRFDLIFSSLVTNLSSFNKDNLQLYPNPANESVSIINDISNYTVIILNTLGQEINRFTSTDKKIQINTSEMKDGIYLFNVISKNGTTLNKILITH